MPTDKPYKVSVRLKQHDRPIRRVPPADTEVGEIAATIVSRTKQAMPGDIIVKMTTLDGEDLCDSPISIALWLALGANIVENTANDTQRVLMQAALSYVAQLLSDPEGVLTLQQMINGIGAVFETISESSIVEQAKKTSTEGKN